MTRRSASRQRLRRSPSRATLLVTRSTSVAGSNGGGGGASASARVAARLRSSACASHHSSAFDAEADVVLVAVSAAKSLDDDDDVLSAERFDGFGVSVSASRVAPSSSSNRNTSPEFFPTATRSPRRNVRSVAPVTTPIRSPLTHTSAPASTGAMTVSHTPRGSFGSGAVRVAAQCLERTPKPSKTTSDEGSDPNVVTPTPMSNAIERVASPSTIGTNRARGDARESPGAGSGFADPPSRETRVVVVDFSEVSFGGAFSLASSPRPRA